MAVCCRTFGCRKTGCSIAIARNTVLSHLARFRPAGNHARPSDQFPRDHPAVGRDQCGIQPGSRQLRPGFYQDVQRPVCRRRRAAAARGIRPGIRFDESGRASARGSNSRSAHPPRRASDLALASNAAVEMDHAANRKITKKRSTGHVDGVVALLMALGAASQAAPKVFDVQAMIA